MHHTRRDSAGVILTIEGEGDVWFDKVVMAAHADQSLALLSDPTPDEHAILSSFEFSDNHVYLHSDPERACGAAGMGIMNAVKPDGRLSASHWMNRLQSLMTVCAIEANA